MGMFTIKPTNSVPLTGPTQRGIFAYGGAFVSISNLISDTGVIADDVTGVGTARNSLAAASYGIDKAIFGYGFNNTGNGESMTNKVSNTGVVATDTTGVGTARRFLAAASFGGDKAIFGYGLTDNNNTFTALSNKVSNSGVVASDTSGVGTVRGYLAAAGFGGSDGVTDKAIFGYGFTSGGNTNLSNLVSTNGTVASDVSGVGTARHSLAAASFGGDKAIFGFGSANSSPRVSMTNLVNNEGVVASDVSGVGTDGRQGACCAFGGDKAIFGGRVNLSGGNMSNLVNNNGVVASDITLVGTFRVDYAGAGFGT